MTAPNGSTPLLEVRDLQMEFPVRSGALRRTKDSIKAVRGISFELRRGETLSLVGESGCGKSTLAKCVMGFQLPTGGQVILNGTDIVGATAAELRRIRRDMQFIFQDPFSSLTPHRTIGRLIEEPLVVHRVGDRQEREDRVTELLRLVGLSPDQRYRYPHEFSGGQRQRVGIARALALEPKLLILDEPVSALDVSIQAQVINLLRDLQERLGLAYLMIAHDLAVVENLSSRVGVMYLGRIVEFGPSEVLFGTPTHPYTQALLSAIPMPDPESRGSSSRRVLTGEVPSVASPPSGCGFRTRCWKAVDICSETTPALVSPGEGLALSACHFPELAKDAKL
jgi:oligopeptide/dipeptide ABC transporter ATP-binding protein